MLRRDFLATTLATPLFNLLPRKTRRVSVICYSFSGPPRFIPFYESHKNVFYSSGTAPKDKIFIPACGPDCSDRELIMIMSVYVKTEEHPVIVTKFDKAAGYYGCVVSRSENYILYPTSEKDLLQVTYSHMDV